MRPVMTHAEYPQGRSEIMSASAARIRIRIAVEELLACGYSQRGGEQTSPRHARRAGPQGEPYMSAAERRLAELLTLRVEDFEEKHYALQAASPIEVLNEPMVANHLQQKDLVDIFRIPGIVSEVLGGKRKRNAEPIAGEAVVLRCRQKCFSNASEPSGYNSDDSREKTTSRNCSGLPLRRAGLPRRLRRRQNLLASGCGLGSATTSAAPRTWRRTHADRGHTTDFSVAASRLKTINRTSLPTTRTPAANAEP